MVAMRQLCYILHIQREELTKNKNQRRTGTTNLESVLDSVTLSNWFKRGSVPPLGIPEYGTIEGEPCYFSMESPKSPSLSIYAPSNYFGTITNRTFQHSNVFVLHFGHSPYPKSPKLKKTAQMHHYNTQCKRKQPK